MTFRRLMLVVIPLLAAVFVFMLLRLLYLDWERSLAVRQPGPAVGTPQIPTGPHEMQTMKNVSHQVSTNVNLVRKDKTGRMEMRFIADRIEHQETKTADVYRPRIQFFSRAGEIVTLMADQAQVITKGSLMNAGDIESGVMWGNVVMIHDRGTPDDHSDDILVGLADLQFNNETYEIWTDGPVLMTGLEMALGAQRMRLVLDRQTRRVNTMTFLEDIYIQLEAEDRLRRGLMAPLTAEPEGTGGSAAAAAPPPPAPPVAKTPPEKTSPDVEKGDLWRIDLGGNVDARQDRQRLICDHLMLYNRSSSPTGDGVEPAGGNVPAAGRSPAEPQVAERQSRPQGTASAEARFLSPDAPPPLVVVATGPLIITPVGSAERKKLADEQHRIHAKGRPVVVDDGETRIVGNEVLYNTRTGSGSVVGLDRAILLEQPGRLRLTGGRLDFDRRNATADVQGEGQLHALVDAASLTGPVRQRGAAGLSPAPPQPAAAAPSATQQTSRLDASWTRSMRLEFYRLPADLKAGPGEIRRATFRGQAVVEQQEGILKGEELAIDFFKAEPGRGQAVERLFGRGDVFVKTNSATTADAATPGQQSRISVGEISCQNLDMLFAKDAAGEPRPKQLTASGNVDIKDSEGAIKAENLLVRFAPSAKGAMEAEFLDARGSVSIKRSDLEAQGDHVRRDMAAGTLLLEGRPARAKRSQSYVVGPHIEFSEPEGRAFVQGAGELLMPAGTDLRGRPRPKAEPMLVRWQRAMLFEDKRNFAQFDGGVMASTDSEAGGGSRLACDRLWIYFADRPQPTPDGATPAPPKKDKATSSSAGDTQDLFGRKNLVRVLAESNVRALEQSHAPDKTVRHRMEIFGDNLTYLEENRKAYVRGPGRLRILARERVRGPDAPIDGVPGEMADAFWKGDPPPGYSRTDIAWTESMAYDGSTDRAYFKGSVDASHVGRGTPGEAGTRARRQPTATRVRSNDLQVVFSEKKPQAPSPTPPGTTPAAPEPPREERMAVEKFIADGNVFLWVGDRRGTAERLIYQREPELLRLYRGLDDWARLWQENEATQQFGEVVARTITYEPSTGRIDVVDQQVMTVSPKPEPQPKPQPKLVPGTERTPISPQPE